MKTVLITLISIFLYSFSTVGQSSHKISTGFGAPELFTIGYNFQKDRFQTGVSIGNDLKTASCNCTSFFYSLSYFIDGNKGILNKPSVYLTSGLGAIIVKNSVHETTYNYTYLRIGSEVNFSRRFGIDLELGYGTILSTKRIKSTYPTPTFYINFEPQPITLNVSLFYRI